MHRLTCWRGLALLAALSHLAPNAAESAEELTFEAHVRPILKAHCFHCHGEAGEKEGELDVRLQRLIVAGGDSGPAIVPGQRAQSLLFDRVRLGEMPPEGKRLSDAEVELIGRWIDEGAMTARAEPDDVDAILVSDEERAFWSFQPIERFPVPQVQAAQRVRTPIDAFLLAKLESHDLSFATEASAAALLRRVSLDLVGLPPTLELIDEFAADNAPGAYERIVERLLASPNYGERWGRHWLDVAGYADSEGYDNEDRVRKYAYKYRDYVIASFNRDQPFDQFIQEQIAGDEIVGGPYTNLAADDIEKLVATGFLRMASDGTGASGADRKLAADSVIADTIKIVSTSLLGLTVGCAQCHDHRYDPIPQRDYYRFRAIFEPGYDSQNWRAPQARLISLYTDADRAAATEIEAEAKKVDAERQRKQSEYIERTFQKELAKVPENVRDAVRSARNTVAKERDAEQQRLLREYPSVNVSAGSLYLYDRKAADELKKDAARATEIRAKKPVEDFIRALSEVPGQVPTTHLFFRGDIDQPREAVEPAGLTVLAVESASSEPLPIDDPGRPTTGRRLAYARRLTSGGHPLLPRVIVNRVWMHHFGRGLVATPSDFGTLGATPSHPRLLDWLAGEFVSSGWSLKHLHRLIVNSTAYQQTSEVEFARHDADPDNRLVSRMPVRRLEAEVIRDSMLAVSGALNGKMHGPAVPVMADRVGQFVIGVENLNAGRPGEVIPMHGEEFRRSIYVQVRRSRPLAVLDTFDAPAMDPNCEIRAASTVAPQALLLMNSDFARQQGDRFANRVREQAGDDRGDRVRFAWKLAFGRAPSDTETRDALAFLDEQARLIGEQSAEHKKPEGDDDSTSPDFDHEALASFCQLLLGANEFLYAN